MFSRGLAIPVLMVASVGVPYVASNSSDLSSSWSKTAKTALSDWGFGKSSSAKVDVAQRRRTDLSPPGPGAALFPNTAPLTGTPALNLAEVFSMNVTKEWVYQHWARKSTGLADLGLYGIRVPLVSGTQLSDLAGSLTYWFDAAGRLQKISFHGRTGDTTRLVAVVTQRFGLQPQPTVVAGEQLFQVQRSGYIYSELKTKPAPVLWANSPHESFTVDLQLQGSNAARPLCQPITMLPAPEVSQQQASSGESEQSDDEDAQKSEEEKLGWKAFFPRSRVPPEQVENLNKRQQIW